MKEHILKIRKEDKEFFNLLKDGIKTIETRAATPNFQKIQEGDVLVFICEKQKLKKKVKKVYLLKTIDQLLEKFDLRKIMPHVSSKEEAKSIWYGFSSYKEKISKYGLVVFVL